MHAKFLPGPVSNPAATAGLFLVSPDGPYEVPPSMKEFFPTALPAGLSSAAFISFLIFALTSSASFGPNNLLIMSVAARSGLRRTLLCILAITLAFGSMLLLGAMGGAAILHHASGPVRILGILGGCSMLYLAWTNA